MANNDLKKGKKKKRKSLKPKTLKRLLPRSKCHCFILCVLKFISPALNGWNTNYNLVSIWGCQKLILTRVLFKKAFVDFPHIFVHDFRAIMTPINEESIDDLGYLSRHAPVGIVIHDKLCGDLANENPEPLIERFISVLTEKQETVVIDVLKRQP